MDRDEPVNLSGCECQAKQLEPTTTHSVFLIQNILEDILHFMEYTDLVKCRQVCHLWNHTAAPLLQKQRTLFFLDYKTFFGNQPSRKLLAIRPLENRSVYYPKNVKTFRSKGLAELTKLLKNSQRLNLSHCFPYRKFQFLDQMFAHSMKNLKDKVLQSFLNIFGKYIDELSIGFHSRPALIYKNSVYISYILHESAVMQLIENLLVNQAPSLSFLSLHILTHVAWEVDGESRGAMSRLRTTDPEFKSIHQNLEGKRKSRKLKLLHWTGQVSAKGLEVILELAPGLKSIVLQTGYEHLLTGPVDRLYLLRSLDMNPRYGSIRSLETLAAAARGQGNLYLHAIYIRFCDCAECVEKAYWTPDLQRRMIHVINVILASTHPPTLKSVDWFGSISEWRSILSHIQFSNVSPKKCKFGRMDDHLYPIDLNMLAIRRSKYRSKIP